MRGFESLSLGLFLLVALFSIFAASDLVSGPIVFLLGVIGLIFAYRYIYMAFALSVFLTPLLGLMVSISTGNLLIGERAFGGSIDVSVAEIVLFFVIAAWGLKLIWLWRIRRDQNWKPHLPLLGAWLVLVGAHLLSVFSPLAPDPLPTVKFSLRPVLFDYLAFIALPVNLIRSRKRLRSALMMCAAVGMLCAATGLVGMFVPEAGSSIGRAHPLPIFGISMLIGENHNELADLMVLTVPLTFAAAFLMADGRMRRSVIAAGVFQFAIGLFTFTRTAWIVFALEAALLFATVWRHKIQKYVSTIAVAAVILFPLALGMVAYSVSSTAQSSNSTRLMLTQIAFEVFTSSPWFGGGAGTFLDRVGSTRVFTIEYGAPLDSHGLIQKIAAETGIIGLLALCLIVFQAVRLLLRGLKWMHAEADREIYILLLTAAGGSFAYQLFNTDYWTGKLWLPLGIALAGRLVLAQKSVSAHPAPESRSSTHSGV